MGRVAWSLVIGFAVVIVVLLTLMVRSWSDVGGDGISVFGIIALTGGIVLTALLGIGLMALVFFSSRHGYDDIEARDD